VTAEPARGPLEGLAAAPTLVALALLLIAVWADGAFALRSWGPLAIFALVGVAAGRFNGVRGPALAMVAAMWGFALWTVLSLAWTGRPGAAVEGSGRALLYAALVTLPVLTLTSRAWAVTTARLLTAGIAAIVALSFAFVLFNGTDWFIAGRLDEPVGYRNGTAALFALCFWPLISVAAQRRLPFVRAGAFALAAVALGLALLTQSRGLVIGFGAGALVALGFGPERVRRAWVAILAIGCVAVVSSDLLAPYDAFVDTRQTSAAAVATALDGLVKLAVGAALVAVLFALFDGGLRASAERLRRIKVLAVAGLAVLAFAGIVAGLWAIGEPASFARDKVSEFKQISGSAAPSETRLGSTGGQRYDLWRIAWREFESKPLTGVGDGAYTVRYYRDRVTEANLDDPHSEPLRVLSELGLVGLLLLGTVIVAAGMALVRGWPTASSVERRWASALAASGAVLLGQSMVDWLWLIPGLTGLGLMCLSTAVAIVALPVAGAERRHRPRPRAWGLVRLVPIAAAGLIALAFLSDVYVRSARASTAASSQERLDQARTAEKLDPLATAPRFLQAGALEELGRRPAAKQELLDVLAIEPDSFVALGLLGDLETRAGDTRMAREWYRRALYLNPRDTGLQQLSR
jgi:O-Antigen ligase